MSDMQTREAKLANDALLLLNDMAEFAYQQGYHEAGYNPIADLRVYIAKVTAERDEARGSQEIMREAMVAQAQVIRVTEARAEAAEAALATARVQYVREGMEKAISKLNRLWFATDYAYEKAKAAIRAALPEIKP